MFSKSRSALLLRALAALLAYPDAELRAALPEIISALRETRTIGRDLRADLIALADEMAAGEPLEIEGRYTDLFDRGRSLSLNLFEHMYGDGRERGPAMVELRERYLRAGLEPVANELPDHLPLVLEYLSCCGRAETRDTLAEIAPILRKIGNALRQRQSRYAAVPAALLALAGVKGLDAEAPPPPPPEDLDRSWEERPAFAPPEPEFPSALSPAGNGRATKRA